MTADTLPALIARLGAATEPSRELDAEIAVAVTPECVGIERAPLDGQPNDWLMVWEPPRRWVDSWLTVPVYPASLDAAVTLVPEGLEWELYEWGTARLSTTPKHPEYRKRRDPGSIAVGATTPALAICIAALRARMKINYGK